MKVITINIDKESVLQEIQMLDGIQVKVPDTMSNEDWGRGVGTSRVKKEDLE